MAAKTTAIAGTSDGADSTSASALIDQKIASLGDWRGVLLARLRELIHAAVPDLVEEVKWRKPSNPAGVSVWSTSGIVCTGETYRDKVKLTFARGALVNDPAGLFNAGLDGNLRRAIDFAAGARIDEVAFKALIRAAAEVNTAKR